jgi:putative flippase GtrA
VSSTGIELALYNILLLIYPARSRVLLLVYSTVGVVGAIVNSFLWNSRWAFRAGAARSGRRAARQRLLFAVQAGCNIAINDGLVGLMATPLLAVLPVAAAANLAKVAGMSAASLFSFVVLRLIVFR